MIMEVFDAMLSDGSQVWNIRLWQRGAKDELVIPCGSEKNAREAAAAIYKAVDLTLEPATLI